jgi:hypothetical protein
MTPRRESTTHGPRLDDELKRETLPLEQGSHMEERTRDEREKEGAADDEPRVELDGAVGLPREATLARRELSRHLRFGVFPATRGELLREAEQNDAPQPVVDLLSELPEGIRFGTVYEAWAALGGDFEPGEEDAISDRTKGSQP